MHSLVEIFKHIKLNLPIDAQQIIHVVIYYIHIKQVLCLFGHWLHVLYLEWLTYIWCMTGDVTVHFGEMPWSGQSVYAEGLGCINWSATDAWSMKTEALQVSVQTSSRHGLRAARAGLEPLLFTRRAVPGMVCACGKINSRSLGLLNHKAPRLQSASTDLTTSSPMVDKYDFSLAGGAVTLTSHQQSCMEIGR